MHIHTPRFPNCGASLIRSRPNPQTHIFVCTACARFSSLFIHAVFHLLQTSRIWFSEKPAIFILHWMTTFGVPRSFMSIHSCNLTSSEPFVVADSGAGAGTGETGTGFGAGAAAPAATTTGARSGTGGGARGSTGAGAGVGTGGAGAGATCFGARTGAGAGTGVGASTGTNAGATAVASLRGAATLVLGGCGGSCGCVA